MVEVSEPLKSAQRAKLAPLGVEPSHFTQLSDVPRDGTPSIVVGNEFLDALPVFQFRYAKSEGWRERLVDCDGDDAAAGMLREVVAPGTTPAVATFLSHPLAAAGKKHAEGTARGGIAGLELAPLAWAAARDVGRRIAADGGAALLVDYGSDHAHANSLRGIEKHEWVGVLEAPGEADLSAWVDFRAVRGAVEEGAGLKGAEGEPARHAVACAPLQTQGGWLQSMGVEARLNELANAPGMSDEEAHALLQGAQRLCDPKQMGARFKAFTASTATGGKE